MPSTNQANTSGKTHENEFEKLVRKPEHVLSAVIDGLRSVEDCRELTSAEVNHQSRSGVIGRINQRKATLEGRDDGS